MAAPYRVLRVTLNRLPGTFRRHVSTGRHQTRPERAGSASELKPSETNATIAGVLCRRSLLVSTPPPTRLPFLAAISQVNFSKTDATSEIAVRHHHTLGGIRMMAVLKEADDFGHETRPI